MPTALITVSVMSIDYHYLHDTYHWPDQLSAAFSSKYGSQQND